jgi:hypothetical protein
VVYWDEDGMKDLLVGQADGRVTLFLNVGSDGEPTFGGGTFVRVGEPGFKTDIDVGSRANLAVVDWNNDGKKDLVVGAYDGMIHLFLNEGSDSSPDFVTQTFAQEDGANLVVPGLRSSPGVLDLDYDGKKDLLTGNTEGQLIFYSNAGSDEAPTFSGYSFVEADGVVIDLYGSARSRPFVCDWTGDAKWDVLIGADDGKVHLYQGVPVPGDFDGDGDVDEDDLGQFVLCFTGPDGGPILPECEPGDFDGDGDIDCDDWEQFVLAWTDPGDPPVPPEAPCDHPIPTVSEYGLTVMILLLLTCGTLVFRRRVARGGL